MTNAEYVRAARARAIAEGKCTSCLREPSRPGMSQCQPCADRRNRTRPERISYTPIDESLARPNVRILRALRRFDAVASLDLLDAMDIDPVDRPGRDRHLQALIREVAQGRAERHLDGGRYLYRITQAGRAYLARLLNPDTEATA